MVHLFTKFIKTKQSLTLITAKKTLFLLFIALIFQSCSTSYQFATSPVVPAAEGTVKVKKDDNNNYSVRIKLERLAEPSRLSPPKALYIVWMTTEQGDPVNIGQITTSKSFFSSILESSLTTVVTQKPTGFFITAENESAITYPDGVTVLRTN